MFFQIELIVILKILLPRLNKIEFNHESGKLKLLASNKMYFIVHSHAIRIHRETL